MYGPHFGLAAHPFAETVDPSAFVPLPSRVATLNRLRHGLESGPGAVAAFGPPGMGKTLLARKLAEALGGSVVHLDYPMMPAAELIAILAQELDAASASEHIEADERSPTKGTGSGSYSPGACPLCRAQRALGARRAPALGKGTGTGRVRPGASPLSQGRSLLDAISPLGAIEPLAVSIQRIRACLASGDGTRRLVILDEAHLIDDPATFEALRMLLNFTTRGTPDLGLVLIGGPDLMEKLPESLADRLGASCPVLPLTASESSAYVLGRLTLAGTRSPLFGPAALAALHHESGGSPRRLNRLADLALLIAFARGQATPDDEAVSLAAREAAFERAA